MSEAVSPAEIIELSKCEKADALGKAVADLSEGCVLARHAWLQAQSVADIPNLLSGLGAEHHNRHRPGQERR